MKSPTNELLLSAFVCAICTLIIARDEMREKVHEIARLFTLLMPECIPWLLIFATLCLKLFYYIKTLQNNLLNILDILKKISTHRTGGSTKCQTQLAQFCQPEINKYTEAPFVWRFITFFATRAPRERPLIKRAREASVCVYFLILLIYLYKSERL